MILSSNRENLRPVYFGILFLLILGMIPTVIAEDATYWVSASYTFGNMGKWNESLDASDKAIAIDPNNKLAWSNRAWALHHLAKYNDALEAAEKAIAIDPNYDLAWVNKANALGGLKRYKEELESSEKTILLNPLLSDAWIDKGQALCNLGNCQDALDATDEAIRLKASSSTAWNNRAWILINLKRYQEAIDAADKAISLNPNYVKAWTNKGNALKYLERYQEALVAYNKALTLDPNYEDAQNNKQFIISNYPQDSTNQSVVTLSNTPSTFTPQPTTVSSPGIQDNQGLFLPLIFVILIIIIGLGAFGYNSYKQKPVKPVYLSSEISPIIPSKKIHHDVFISYAQNDKPIADATCAKLESHNIRCWISPRDIPPGENFPKAIIEGIEGSKIMVLIFSTHSNNSQHVIREITSAINKSLILIPLRIEDFIPSKEMEYLISTPHWLDAITPPLEKHLDTLATTINKILSDDKCVS